MHFNEYIYSLYIMEGVCAHEYRCLGKQETSESMELGLQKVESMPDMGAGNQMGSPPEQCTLTF